jgi:hypothetical protein
VTLERLDPNLRVRCSEAFEVFTVSGQDLRSSACHGLSHDKGIDCRGRTSRSQEPTRDSAMSLTCFGDAPDDLQYPVHGSISRSAANRFSQDDHWNLDRSPGLQGASQKGHGPWFSPRQSDDRS